LGGVGGVLPRWLFAVLLASGVWIGTTPAMAAVWVAVIAIAYAVRSWILPLPPERAEDPSLLRSLAVALFAALPTFVYLFATWNQEFPYNGDQKHHNGRALEAFIFWWPWRWIVAVAAILVVVRWARPRTAVAAVALLPILGCSFYWPYAFAGQYPGTLHFIAVPLHFLSLSHPLNVERTLNALTIPAWLLVLRPLILRKPATFATLATSALLFWQKDVVYYFASGYLEPWAVVLLLTALEHLVIFDAEALWRPLLLIGTAAIVKEQFVIALPVVAAVYFPRRDRWRHILLTLTALAPFTLFFALRASFHTWSGTLPAFNDRFATYARNVTAQFGPALAVVVVGLISLLALARRRAFLAIFLVAAADAAFFYMARVQQPWTGYSRTNMVPLVCAAIGLGAVTDRLPKGWAAAAVAAVVACNVVPLIPAMRLAFGPDTARNFLEHDDAAMFFPIRAAITAGERAGLIHPGDEVRVLNDGRRVFIWFWGGPIEDQYPDLASRYRLRIVSFSGAPARCRCTSGAAQLAVFIAFHNLGVAMPQRGTIEAESAQCRAAMRATCARTIALDDAVIGR
jgi:hypothetical protein